MALDVTDSRTPRAIVAEALAQFGRLDILVNHAGGSRPTAADAPDAVWEESWTLNFTAVRRLTQACLPAMQRQQRPYHQHYGLVRALRHHRRQPGQGRGARL